MIDFAAGTTSSPTHWNVNEYNVRAIARRDLALSGTTRTFDPSWIWPTIQTNREAGGLQQAEGTKSVSFKPPPLVTVIVAKDRIPWIKPPPVKKAKASQVLPHMKRRSGVNSWNNMSLRDCSRRCLPKSIQITGHTVSMIEKGDGRFYSYELLDLRLAVSLM